MSTPLKALLYFQHNLINLKDKTKIIAIPKGLSGSFDQFGTATEITDETFKNNIFLKSITIPENVTSISENAFQSCQILAEINVSEKNKNYSSVGGILYNKDKTKLIYCPSAIRGRIDIPDTVKEIVGGDSSNPMYSVFSSPLIESINVGTNNKYFSSIGGILYNKDKTAIIACPKAISGSVTLPNTLTEIKDFAFYQCYGLNNITIPDSVTSIGSNAFSNCTNLKSIMIPESVTSIGAGSFSNCTNLKSIMIPESVTSIQGTLFRGCTSLKRIDVSEGNKNYTSIDGVLYNKDKTELIECPCGKEGIIELPDTVTRINNIYDCDLIEEIKVSENNKNFYLKNGVLYSKDNITVFVSRATMPESIEVDLNSEEAKRLNYEIIDGVLYATTDNFTYLAAFPAGKKGNWELPYDKWLGSGLISLTNSLESITVGENFKNYVSIDGVLYSVNRDGTLNLYVFPGGKTGTVNIPASVTGTVTYYVLNSMKSIDNINVDSNNEFFTSIDGVLYNKNLTSLLACPGKKKGKITVPESVTEFISFNGCKDVTICAVPGSHAELYAKSNNIPFEPLDTETIEKPTGIYGDMDGDEVITSSDALTILRASISIVKLTAEKKALADIDSDGEITANDALAVLRYSVGMSGGHAAAMRPQASSV